MFSSLFEVTLTASVTGVVHSTDKGPHGMILLHPGGRRTFIADMVESRPFVLLSLTVYQYPESSEPCIVVFPMGRNEIRAHTIVVGVGTRWLPIVPESVYAPPLASNGTRKGVKVNCNRSRRSTNNFRRPPPRPPRFSICHSPCLRDSTPDGLRSNRG